MSAFSYALHATLSIVKHSFMLPGRHLPRGFGRYRLTQTRRLNGQFKLSSLARGPCLIGSSMWPFKDLYFFISSANVSVDFGLGWRMHAVFVLHETSALVCGMSEGDDE